VVTSKCKMGLFSKKVLPLGTRNGSFIRNQGQREKTTRCANTKRAVHGVDDKRGGREGGGMRSHSGGFAGRRKSP